MEKNNNRIVIKGDAVLKNLKLNKQNYKEERKFLLDYRKFGKYVLWNKQIPIFKGGFGNDKIRMKSYKLNRLIKEERLFSYQAIVKNFEGDLKEIACKRYREDEESIPKLIKMRIFERAKCIKEKYRTKKNKTFDQIASNQLLTKSRTAQNFFNKNTISPAKEERRKTQFSFFGKGHSRNKNDINENDFYIPDYDKKKYDRNYIFEEMNKKYHFIGFENHTRSLSDSTKCTYRPSIIKYDKNKYSMFEKRDVELYRNKTPAKSFNRIKQKVIKFKFLNGNK